MIDLAGERIKRSPISSLTLGFSFLLLSLCVLSPPVWHRVKPLGALSVRRGGAVINLYASTMLQHIQTEVDASRREIM